MLDIQIIITWSAALIRNKLYIIYIYVYIDISFIYPIWWYSRYQLLVAGYGIPSELIRIESVLWSSPHLSGRQELDKDPAMLEQAKKTQASNSMGISGS